MLRVDPPTLVHPRDLINSAEAQTEVTPVPDKYGTYWMPATQRISPSRDFASAAGAMTIVQDRQALFEALKENPVPDHNRVQAFAPWSDVLREMVHDAKSMIYLPAIIIAGLLVMMWIMAVNGPEPMSYKIVPRSPSSVQTVRSQTPAHPSQRHRKPVMPVPSPSRTKAPVTPVEPSPAHSEAPVPVPIKPRPTPRHTVHPDPTPTKTLEPTPTKASDPEPTVGPVTQEPKPTEVSPTPSLMNSVTPGS